MYLSIQSLQLMVRPNAHAEVLSNRRPMPQAAAAEFGPCDAPK